MKTVLISIVSMFLMNALMAGENASVEEEANAAIQGFNDAYANNDVEAYFDYYADDATVFFYGERQDIDAYHALWKDTINAGGGVEKYEMSDLQVQILAGGEVVISTAFIDNVTRSAEGERTKTRAFETDVWQKIEGEWKILSLHYTDIKQ